MGELLDLALVYLKIGSFTFGGGLVMLAFIEQDVVTNFGWLTHREFVDGIALGQITPGPVSITAVFVGYKVAGILGGTIAWLAIWMPSFLATLVMAGQSARLRKNPSVQAVLKGVGPAVIGLVLASGVYIAQGALTVLPEVILAAVCLFAIVRFKLEAPVIVIGAGLVGALVL